MSIEPTNLSGWQRRSLILWKQKKRGIRICSRFTHAKGQTTNLLRKTKRSFFREKIDENKGNPKGVWKALKSLSGTSKPRVRINEITTENEVVSDESVLANELNEYFVNILEQIGNHSDAGVNFESTKLKNFVHSSLNVDTVYNIPLLTIKQTIAIIDKISSNKASGYDGLSVRVRFASTFGCLQILYANYLIFQYRQTVFLTTGK